MNRHGNESANSYQYGGKTGAGFRHFSEAEWIDWIGMDIAGAKREDMRRHLEICSRCRELHDLWVPLLEGPPPAAVLRQADASPPPVQATEPLFPRDAVRRKLRRTVQRTGRQRRLAALTARASFRRRTAALGACVLTGLLVLGLYGTLRDSGTEQSRYVSNYEPQALAVLNKPETVSYRLDGSRNDQFSGNLWYNGNSNELLVLIEDLGLHDGHSIQAWAVSGSRRDPLGLVQIEAAKGHLYVQGTQLDGADNIALTVEPPGGSLSPTSPDAVWVHLGKP